MASLAKLYAHEAGAKRKFDKSANGDPSDEDEAQKKMRGLEEGEMHQVRLAKEIREKPATNPENQKLVDAFLKYGEEQLERGHTGKGTSHLRAAKYIRDYDQPIRTGADALGVDYVGTKMAGQVEDILRTGKVQDDTFNMNVSDQNHAVSELVASVRDTPAKCPENQQVVDALANFGEHELVFGNSGKGVSHLRSAREIHNADTVIQSATDARQAIPLIGDVMADKIDQILNYGKIVRDSGSSTSRRPSGSLAPIVEFLLQNPAKNPANQDIVNALIDYGDSHLHSGHRGKGISHLRAAKEICLSEHEIKSGSDATQIAMVGPQVAAKIDQIILQGHADSDEDYEDEEDGYEEDEEGGVAQDEDETMEEEDNDQQKRGKRRATSEFGRRDRDHYSAPIIRDIRHKLAKVIANQYLVDAITDYAEDQLTKRHTGRGITFARAARHLRDATSEIKSGKDAKGVGMIGDKVAAFIERVLAKSKRGQAAP